MEPFAFFYKIRDMLRLRRAVAMADEAHAQTGDRYYVMAGGDGKLFVVNRQNFRILRRKHYIDERASIRDLVRGSFYFTPYRDGAGAIPPDVEAAKKRLYLVWAKECRKVKRQRRKR